MSPDERVNYEEYVIKMGFDSKLKTYNDAKKVDTHTMKHAIENAFPLPMNQFYSTFVEIEGSKNPMFARYEVHQRVECTKNYVIRNDEESKDNSDLMNSEQPRKMHFEEESDEMAKINTFRSLTFYEYQIKISAFDSIENYLMEDEIVLFP